MKKMKDITFNIYDNKVVIEGLKFSFLDSMKMIFYKPKIICNFKELKWIKREAKKE